MQEVMKEWGQQLLQQYWVDRLDKRLPGIVTLVVVLLLMQSLAQLTWRLVPVPVEATRSANRSVNSVIRSTPNSRNRAVAQTIAGWNLFGAIEVKKAAPVVNIQAAPETRLNLKLRGVFAASNPSHARAIIADEKNNEESYAVGDPVPGGAILHEVFSDKVILDHNGVYETLRLPVDEAGGNGQGMYNPRGGPPGHINFRNAVTPPGRPMIAHGDTSAMLRQYRDALLNNPQSVMGLVRATPYEKGGRLHGYRITPGTDHQVLSRFGLKSGDVVTAVNGIPMNNPIKALEVLRNLSTANQLTVNIERRGVPQSFTFAINP